MYLTKIWLIGVGLALAVVLALALVVPRPAMRELEKEQVARLAHVQHASQLLLKVDARSKIDYAAHLAGDVVLAGALDEASRGGTDKGLHQTALERLRVFNGQLKMGFLAALDARGRVLARVTESGEGDAQAYGDSMAGFPVIADALRGYRGEDAVAIGGKLYRLAVAPVVSKGHDRYAGALVIGMSAGEDLAKRMHESLGAEVAFLLRGKVLASTAATPALDKLGAELEKHAEDTAKQGHTQALAIESGASDRWWAMATPVAGEAAAQDAWYVLLLPRTAGTGLGGLLHASSGDDFKGGNFPWILVLMVAAVALAGGLAILWWELDSPMARLRDETGRLAAGELPRLDERPFRGRYAQVVRSINATLDRLVRSGGVVGVTTLTSDRGAPAPVARDREPSSRIPTVEEPLPASYEPMMIAGQAAPVEAKLAAPPMPKLPGQSDALPKFPLEALDDDGTTQAEALPVASGARASARPSLPELPQLDAIPLDSHAAPAPKPRPATRPGQPPATPRAPAPQIATPAPVGMGRAAAPPPAAAKPAAPKPAAPPPRRPTPFGLPVEELDISPSSGLITNAVAAGPDGGIAPLPPPPAADFGDETVVSQPSNELIDQSRGTGVKSDLDAYFRKIYQDFVELKRKCGEPTENVTFEKFVGKLRDNREQLIKKLGCKSVKFQVYVKDGRAALKATPVRD